MCIVVFLLLCCADNGTDDQKLVGDEKLTRKIRTGMQNIQIKLSYQSSLFLLHSLKLIWPVLSSSFIVVDLTSIYCSTVFNILFNISLLSLFGRLHSPAVF